MGMEEISQKRIDARAKEGINDPGKAEEMARASDDPRTKEAFYRRQDPKDPNKTHPGALSPAQQWQGMYGHGANRIEEKAGALYEAKVLEARKKIEEGFKNQEGESFDTENFKAFLFQVRQEAEKMSDQELEVALNDATVKRDASKEGVLQGGLETPLSKRVYMLETVQRERREKKVLQ